MCLDLEWKSRLLNNFDSEDVICSNPTIAFMLFRFILPYMCMRSRNVTCNHPYRVIAYQGYDMHGLLACKTFSLFCKQLLYRSYTILSEPITVSHFDDVTKYGIVSLFIGNCCNAFLT